MSAMGAMPAALSSAQSALSSSAVPYGVFRSYRRWGRYPSGATEWLGGGSHTASTPAARICHTLSRTSAYQLRSLLSPNEHERQ